MLIIDERGSRVALHGTEAEPALDTQDFSAAATHRLCRGRTCDVEYIGSITWTGAPGHLPTVLPRRTA
jgi:hypothetical protein